VSEEETPPSPALPPREPAAETPAASPVSAPPRRAARRAVLLLSGLSLGLLGLLALGGWVLTPFRVATASMEPALRGDLPGRPGDTILVNRLAYLCSGPSRWEVVAFRPVEAEAPKSQAASIVKRVVGLPGETVEIRDGDLLVDGRPVPRPRALEPVHYVRSGSFGSGPVVLGPEEYFVLGDNSYPSIDSRRFGPLPRVNLIGKAVWIIAPLERAGPIR
jgi:signal peptidase I